MQFPLPCVDTVVSVIMQLPLPRVDTVFSKTKCTPKVYAFINFILRLDLNALPTPSELLQ